MTSFVTTAAIAAMLLATACFAAGLKPSHVPQRVRTGDPDFHGYIVLAQYECMDLLCPDWSLQATRLATECFTWNCTNEEKIELQLVPKSPIAKMNFSVYTAYHNVTRSFFVAGITADPPNRARLWTVSLANNFSSFTLKNYVEFEYPNAGNVFASLEVNAKSGKPLALWEDGTLQEITPSTGAAKVVANVLSGNTTRVVTQASAVDTDRNLLFANFNDGFGSEIGFATVDLNTYTVTATTLMNLATNGIFPEIFASEWIPDIQHLIVFATGNWDQLIYVNPATGNSSYAVYEIDNLLDAAQFCDVSNVKVCDTCKNVAYDRHSKMLYFAATIGDCITGTDSLLSVGPIAAGAPQPFYWIDTALSPMDFGYQGMIWAGCHPNCPT